MMPSDSKVDAGGSQRPMSLLTLALWTGLVTGFAEVAAIGPELVGSKFCYCSQDVVWLAPAFDAALFGLIGVVGVLLARLIPVSWRVAAGVFAGFGVLLVLFHFQTLHRLAALVLAAGVGAQVVRSLAHRVRSAARFVSRSLPWLALSVAALAGVMIGWRAVRERRLAASRPAAQPGAPNVLLLILDTVRAANLSLYGYARHTTPELERFAERGTLFERAFAPASWTLPSHSSMFTGRWPLELDVSWETPLGPRWPVLAEVLRASGYATAAFVANDNRVSWESGLARGFEHFDDAPLSLWKTTQTLSFGLVFYAPIREWLKPILSRTPLLWRMRLPPPGTHRSAEEISHALLAWHDRARPAPFFAFLNFMDGHLPYTIPDSFRLRYHSSLQRPVSSEQGEKAPDQRLTPADLRLKQDSYDGAIGYLDSQLGWLLRELQRRRLLDNTLVIVTADHGEEFAEHGLVAHGTSLYRSSIHVPLLLWFPGRVPEGRRVSEPVSLRNLAATVVDLLDSGPAAPLPGRSLARFWTEAGAAPDTIVTSVRQVWNQPGWYPASRGDVNSIAFDGWRYIRNEGDGAEELYDFDHDLLERWNLAQTAKGAQYVHRYRAALDAMLGAAPRSVRAGR